MNLSTDAQASARAFIVAHARPLERAWYAYQFESGPAEAVLDTLAAFQNADGGFGHGLEPDVQLPNSSAIDPLRFGGRVIHRTFTPSATLLRRTSPICAARSGVMKAEKMTIDCSALSISSRQSFEKSLPVKSPVRIHSGSRSG